MKEESWQRRTAPVQFTVREEEGSPIIEGYFAVFNSPYELWEGAEEIILPGAFSDTLGEDVRALIDHDTRLVLGRTKAGTLRLREDEKGLFGSISINPKDADAMNLYARVQRGDVDQCSFGFDILEQETETDALGNVRWKIKKVRLYEVSVVTFPAYKDTEVQARREDHANLQQRREQAWKDAQMKKLKGE